MAFLITYPVAGRNPLMKSMRILRDIPWYSVNRFAAVEGNEMSLLSLKKKLSYDTSTTNNAWVYILQDLDTNKQTSKP